MEKTNSEMSVIEASEYLGVTSRSVINYVKSKEIEGIKVGKSWFLKKASVESFKMRYCFRQQESEINDSSKRRKNKTYSINSL